VVDSKALRLTDRQPTPETGWGAARAGIATAGAVVLGWHSPEHTGLALIAIMVVASPALARAFAPLLAHLPRR
jgi:hypothetical protein